MDHFIEELPSPSPQPHGKTKRSKISSSPLPLRTHREPSTTSSRTWGFLDPLISLVLPSSDSNRNKKPTSIAFDEESNDEMDELLHEDAHGRGGDSAFSDDIELREHSQEDMSPSTSQRINIFNHHVLYSIYGFNIDPTFMSNYVTHSEWEKIPQDVFLIIFSFLPYESLIVSVSQVCKEWFYLSQKNILWEKFFVFTLFPSKHSRFIFSSFQDSKSIPQVEKSENLLESIQNRFFIPLFDPNPNNNISEDHEGDIEEEKRMHIKNSIEKEIVEDLEDKFMENNFSVKSLVGPNYDNELPNNQSHSDFYNLLHASYICSFYKLCFQKLNNFVSTATKQLESHQQKKQNLETLYDMCHNTQYYFTFYFGVPLCAISTTLCLALQLFKMNIPELNVDKDNPNAIDGWWMIVFAFLYMPLFCGIIILFQQFIKTFLRFKLKSRQTVQGIFLVVIALIFMLGLTGFFFMVNLSCVFPLPPKYLAPDAPDTEFIRFYGFRKIVNNYSFIMSPFLIAFVLITFVSWLSQTITIYAAFNANRRLLIIRNVINSAIHLFFLILVAGSFALLHFSQKADSSPETEEELTQTISYILIGMHVLIAIMHLATCIMFGFILKRFCTFFTPAPKQPKMKKLAVGLMICVVIILLCSLAVEVVLGINYKWISAPLLPAPTIMAISFYIIAAMYKLWIS
ncbi:hypothetical protein C9374_011434 [Naegleria lovaniensis]|uniref:F-box domain-containing protein n=1 Tax=Naegleria lovaniensis TaxID=51637 RepID=A0AA88KRJ1_NAELO|nr:uncharacterized protein C9374_011434 [Naegleria lovaniensis]KAG2392709.1 hypothetical protein C9374_011434 [Naegleria lovaniensis]